MSEVTLRWVLGMLIAGVPWAAAQANSVDCQKPATKIDQLVCGNQSLLNLDTKYAQAYRAARDSAEDHDKFLKLAASDLKWRADNCADVACLEEWYGNVTPRYRAFASNARLPALEKGRERSESVESRSSKEASVSPKNLAVGQCRIVRGYMSSVPLWRDNGVPVAQAWTNVGRAVVAFVPSSDVIQQWEQAVRSIYASRATVADVEKRYASLCDQYEGLQIAAPRPR